MNKTTEKFSNGLFSQLVQEVAHVVESYTGNRIFCNLGAKV